VETMNDQFDEYRDCLRLVWNLALRHRLKGAVALPDVSKALLDALVLDDLRGATTLNTQRTAGALIPGRGWVDGYIPALGVVISAFSPEAYQPEEYPTEIVWKRAELPHEAKGTVLFYADVFDFRSADAMFDFEYVKAIASVDSGSVGKGSLVLLRRSEVDIVDLAESGMKTSVQ